MTNSERITNRRAFPGLDASLGPARPLSAGDTQWLIEQVVDRVRETASKPRRRLLSVRSLSLAALVVVTSAAAATLMHQVRTSADFSQPNVGAPQRQTRTKPAWHAPAASASEVVSATAPTTQPTAAQNDSTRSVAAFADGASAPVTDVSARAARVQTPATVNASSATSEVAPMPATVAADELSIANELRRKAQWRAAEAAYRDVTARYPTTQEAIVALLAAAELRLDHLGDAQGALRLFRTLPRRNTLGVEALFGTSRAYRALGNRAAESATLQALLDDYPTSLQADSARQRLREINAESAAP